jgi:hypothetical protein
MMELSFEAFPKIPRRKAVLMVVTEKLDGTNAQINIPADPEQPLLVGSRNRVITPGKATDNYGFAAWVAENEQMLRRLGPGRHYGEWWGSGIGRRYDKQDRTFSLFDTHRFMGGVPEGCPVSVVPLLCINSPDIGVLDACIEKLRQTGSVAAPGFMRPEGVVVRIGKVLWKEILDKDGPSPEEGES